MKVASTLTWGRKATPELAERAVRMALGKAGLNRAACVLLFLTRDFARQAQPAILAAARAAGSLEVFGSTASGLFTENEVLLDQVGAAALVIGDIAPVRGQSKENNIDTLLSFSGHSALPYDWQTGRARAGLLDSDARTWAHGRLTDHGCADFTLPGEQCQAVSTGLRRLAPALPVDICAAYELRQVAGQPAASCLRRHLPAELREHPPLHQIAVLQGPDEPGIAILSANADGSLTLAEALAPGAEITWALRQPLTSEQEMEQSLLAASQRLTNPAYALMFSCIGRGPLFYGGEDRDQRAFRQRFPGLPMLGAYGSGQIAAGIGKNRLFHNSVVTLLFEGSHV